jgi:hypothetical protein
MDLRRPLIGIDLNEDEAASGEGMPHMPLSLLSPSFDLNRRQKTESRLLGYVE